MTRLVPRPDWTPVELVLAVRAAVWEQGVTPEMAANRPTVLALFRPAEEPGIITATADHARPLEPIPWDDDYPRETPAPVAPPPAEAGWIVLMSCCGRSDGERRFASWEEANAFRESYISGVGVHPHGYSAPPHESGHRRAAIVTPEMMGHATAPPPAEERKDRVAALDELATELASMQAETDLTDYWERWSKALTALRSELAASQREVERLRAQVADLEFDVGRLLIERYARPPVPSGENRSEPAAPPPAGEPACRDCGLALHPVDVAVGRAAHALYSTCIAALRAENERLRRELEARS